MVVICWRGRSRTREGGSNSPLWDMSADLVRKLKIEYPELRFVRGRKFAFRPPKTIVVGPSEEAEDLLLLHEVGHAILGHRDFKTDVGRLKMEMAAWEKARELTAVYGVKWDEEVAQGELDTYRDWLHQKSRCPVCGLTRFETPDGQYHCPKCEEL